MPAMKKFGPGCRSSANPYGSTVPQLWKFGSNMGANRQGASTMSSRSRRISRSIDRSGRQPVQTRPGAAARFRTGQRACTEMTVDRACVRARDDGLKRGERGKVVLDRLRAGGESIGVGFGLGPVRCGEMPTGGRIDREAPRGEQAHGLPRGDAVRDGGARRQASRTPRSRSAECSVTASPASRTSSSAARSAVDRESTVPPIPGRESGLQLTPDRDGA